MLQCIFLSLNASLQCISHTALYDLYLFVSLVLLLKLQAAGWFSMLFEFQLFATKSPDSWGMFVSCGPMRSLCVAQKFFPWSLL